MPKLELTNITWKKYASLLLIPFDVYVA